MNMFGFDLNEAQKARDESLPKSLTAGKYKLMVTQVETGIHPFGGQFTTPATNPTDPDVEVRVSCVLVEATNGFKEGWKHTLFFSPYRMNKDNPTQLSTKALIDRGDLADLAFACCGTKPQSEQELVQKQFYVTFKETTGKDGKSYLNIEKIESLASASEQPMPTGSAVPTTAEPAVNSFNAEPDWK